MRTFLFSLLILLSVTTYAQITDDFETGNISDWTESTTNHWEATNLNPLNGNYSLHHAFDNPSSGHDQISRNLSNIAFTQGTAIWQFQVKHEYAPSGSNKWACFLMSDKPAAEMHPGGSANGYAFGVNYTGTSDIIKIWKITNGSASQILNTGVNWETDFGTETYGFKVTRSATGEWAVYADSDGGFDNLAPIGATANNTDYTSATYFGFYYAYSASQDRKFWIDDISITGAEGNNADSEVSAGADNEPNQISSTATVANGVQVFDVTLSDAGTSDNLPTIINSIAFSKGDHNMPTNWASVIAGAKLYGDDLTTGMTGIISENKITFSNNSMISIADGNSETYKLHIWLKPNLSAISDNDNFEFALNYTDIECDPSGSSFGSGQIESGDDKISVDIQAVELKFISYPQVVAPNTDFSVTIAATDENGNTDNDYSANVTMSLANGNGNLNSVSGLTGNITNGEYSWNDLQYNQIETFSLQAVTPSIPAVTSPEIECSDFVYNLFDDFEDGNIAGWQESVPGRWSASSDEPLNGSFSLKHIYDNSSSATDVIAFNHNIVNLNEEEKVWRFRLKYPISDPSSNNNWAVALCSDKGQDEILTKNFSGYVIGVNYNPPSDDLLKLWKVDNGTVSEVVTTAFNWKNTNANVQKGFEVSRTTVGEWEIKIDEDGSFDLLTSYGTGTENSFNESQYVGVIYKYSTSSDQLLRIDDIYFGPVIPDNEPPKVIEVTAISANSLQIVFNEELDSNSSQNTANYIIDNSYGNPQNATLQADNRKVILDFNTDFDETKEYTITINNVEDLEGNILNNSEHKFAWTSLKLLSAVTVSSTELMLNFSKAPSQTSLENTSNYSADNGLGNPSSVAVSAEDNTMVKLTFSQAFAEQQEYILNVENMEDQYGNPMPATEISFLYYLPESYDIIVNEIMCDINPLPQALPPYKYIEIYNRSAFKISLTGWKLQIGDNSPVNFPSKSLNSGQYMLICEPAAETAFASYAEVAPILTASQLTTSDKSISLKDASGNLIEFIEYDKSWYGDTDKNDGGWSIERIDYENFCGTNENWHASENVTGGTPGSQNSVYAENPDNSKPEISQTIVISSKELMITFSEKPDAVSALTLENYTVNETIQPTNASFDANDVYSIHIFFNNNFPIGTNTLKINNISDPCGNIMQEYNSSFFYELIHPKYAQAISETQLKIYFSEKPKPESAQNISNYIVDNSIGSPKTAQISNTNSSVVYLNFDTNFTEKQKYTITVSNISDVNDNIIQTANLNFTYYIPQAFNVVFSEIMSDVNPAPEGLPKIKYVELYNTCDYDLDLSDWVFVAEGQSERIFPPQILKSGDYLILSQEKADFGGADVLDILESSDLSSSGKEIKLFDAKGNLINEISYTKDWYGDSDKNDGGWSLEIIDPYNFCQPGTNWLPSESPTGGTPGNINSVNDLNPDTETPQWDTLHVVSSKILDLYFSENLSKETSHNTNNYILNNNIKPLKITNDRNNIIRLEFEEQFADNGQYSLTISNLSDNCGNIIDEQTRNFKYERINVKNLWIEDSKHLILDFSEIPDYNSASNTSNFSLTPEPENPEYLFTQSNDSTLLHILFADTIPDGKTLTFSVKNILDKNGNTMPDWDTSFVLRTIKPLEIVINEILFNPYPDGADFVEIYNNSEYDLDLKNLSLAKREADGSIKKKFPLSEVHKYIEAGKYFAYTDGKEMIMQDYYSENPNNIFELPDFPSFPDKSATVVLLGANDLVIDEFTYNEKMHFPLLADNEGVSLERISPDKPTQNKDNWHSAAETAGFATPAYKNSQQQIPSSEIANQEVELEPKIFSPDQDGIDDFVNINYSFEEGGYTASITIFDAKGRQMRVLKNNLLLSTSGSIKWDGLFEDGSLMRPGIYIIYFKAFNAKGDVKEYKKVVTLAVKY